MLVVMVVKHADTINFVAFAVFHYATRDALSQYNYN